MRDAIMRTADYLSISTSVDLMIVLTTSPVLSPSCSADVRLMSDTISMFADRYDDLGHHVPELDVLNGSLELVRKTLLTVAFPLEAG
jgi:hypothetical protein